MKTSSEFDTYAHSYDEALAAGIAISGEDKNYFAEKRISFLKKLREKYHFDSTHVMDFGCGTGSATPFLLSLDPKVDLIGIDISAKSLAVARETIGGPRAIFFEPARYVPQADRNLVFSNGTFHHIPPADRKKVMEFIHASLCPNGIFALWENNPWNPGTRYCMKHCPFDSDAITLTPPEARRLIQNAGFEIIRTDFLFIFPRFLRFFRWLEPLVSRLPFGAQYQVLARKSTEA